MARGAANGKPPKLAPPASPTVSVVIVVYEAGPTLSECLAALKAQTFRDFEIVRRRRPTKGCC